MCEAVVIRAGGGELIGDAPERRVELLSDHEALHATWSRYGPHREGADLHVHRRHTDLFYALEGELTIRLGPGGEGTRVPQGKLARIPPFVVHGFRNDGDADVSYINLHAPGEGFAAFMRAMRDGRDLSYDQHPPPPDGGRPTADAVIGGDTFVTDTPGGRIALLADIEEIAVAEVQSAPDGPAPPPHLHRGHLESLYVLEGEVAVTSRDRELRAEGGSWVQVPPGAPHSLSFRGAGSTRYLSVHAPGAGFGAFVRALAETGDEELAAARSAFDQEPAP